MMIQVKETENVRMDLTIEVKTLDDLSLAARDLLRYYPSDRVFALYGEMGAGKTTLVKALCEQLQVKDTVSSPTFAVINEYRIKDGEKVYHFDFYRLKNELEAYDLGYEEYIYSKQYCFMEWPEKIEGLVPYDCVRIKILVEGNTRVISARK